MFLGDAWCGVVVQRSCANKARPAFGSPHAGAIGALNEGSREGRVGCLIHEPTYLKRREISL